ncbi:protein arginine N-methyltransferase 9 isoform X2 [Thalassophryne amazonica]|uniref:protein arginine N-methyltransferase 9 isoform X2 n=1 Tax=Thalassophryne amazonica TaxID=390379 RepID=UPI001470EEBF|nr:protein arginine N-methyltransferase 9 isoform X2 [Thalassophryne amazonica]
MPHASAKSKHGRRARRRHREDPARNELLSCSLESAQQCLFNHDYGTAFVHYLLVLNLAPEFKNFAKESFRFTLFKWTEELESVGRIQELFDCYEQALELFPSDEVILNSMGEHLFRMGFRDEAACHFHKALKVRPEYPEARENFYRVANWLVERWHFLMLNDHGRNRKYQQAIQKAVQSGCSTVLDIGTGTGILGMCAKKAGAAEVYACELSKTMYDLACEVVTANGMDGSIKILHKKSMEMEVPKDIPHRVSLVVTETVDAGLFGEGIIESLIHAWQHLLLPPQRGDDEFQAPPSVTGRVIPAGATMFGMAIECAEIRRHHRLCVSEVGGLSLAAAGQLCSPVSCSAEPDDATEPYTTERLIRVPGGYKPLTNPFRALNIDFNNMQELEGLSSRKVHRIHLPVTEQGELDALAVWFQLHLDKDNCLSTGPEEDTCWEQAIYPVHSIKGFSLKRGDELIVDISCHDAYLRLYTVAVVRDGHEIYLDKHLEYRRTESSICNSNPEAELCSALACLQTDRNRGTDFCLLECSEMALLNNKDYHQSFRNALSRLISQLKVARQNQERGSGVQSDGLSTDCHDLFYVLDVSEGFSLLSLIAASQGDVKAFSSVEKTKQQEVLKRMALSSNIPKQNLEFWLNNVDGEQAMLQRPSKEKLWSAIILDCIETCGLIRQKLMEKASLARCLLEEGGRIFPERIVIYGVLVESDTLLMESAVQGLEPTLGFNIAPFINQFTVQATLAGRITAIPFWYQVHLDQEISVSTLSQNSHWKQAAVVLQQPLDVRARDCVRLSVMLHKSTISMSACIDNTTE